MNIPDAPNKGAHKPISSLALLAGCLVGYIVYFLTRDVYLAGFGDAINVGIGMFAGVMLIWLIARAIKFVFKKAFGK